MVLIALMLEHRGISYHGTGVGKEDDRIKEYDISYGDFGM